MRFLLVLLVSALLGGTANTQDGPVQEEPEPIDPTKPVCGPIEEPLLCFGSYDPSPLGERIPLILIHGLNWREIPGGPDLAAWDNLVNYFSSFPWFAERYKLYQVRYISNLVSASDLGRILAELVDVMDVRDPEFSVRQAAIVAHSMGGLVARSFMEENQLTGGVFGGERVLKLITLGTPHHGTPAANGPARDEKAGPFVGPVIETFDYLLFGGNVTWASYNRYDLHWTNHDLLFDYDRFPEDDNLWLRSLNERSRFSGRITAYAGQLARTNDACAFAIFDFNLRCAAEIMKIALSVLSSDGAVPQASAAFQMCPTCRREYFLDYDHFQLLAGKTVDDSNLFGAVAGDLAELVADGDPRFDGRVWPALREDEPFHALRNWGTIQMTDWGPLRRQPIRGRSSFDLYIDQPGVNHNLLTQFMIGPCDDSFDLYIESQLIGSFDDDRGGEGLLAIVWPVSGSNLSRRRVTITFENRASDDCGTAAVRLASLSPDIRD